MRDAAVAATPAAAASHHSPCLVLVGLRESVVAELEALEVLLAGVLAGQDHLAALVEVVAHGDDLVESQP